MIKIYNSAGTSCEDITDYLGDLESADPDTKVKTLLLYKVSSIFNRVKRESSYRGRFATNKEGVSLLSKYEITDDDKDFFLDKLKAGADDVFTKLTAWAKTLYNAYQFNVAFDEDVMKFSLNQGRAIKFNGTDQNAYFADEGALDIAEADADFCLSGWVKTGDDITDYQSLFGKDCGNGIYRYGFIIQSGEIKALVQTAAFTELSSVGYTVAENTWYHLLMRVDKTNSLLYFYVNGVLQNEAGEEIDSAFANMADNYKFYIGGGQNNAGSSDYYFADCAIRDVRVFQEDVTDSIDDIIDGKAVGSEVAWWPCEDENKGFVADISGNDYNMLTTELTNKSFITGNWISVLGLNDEDYYVLVYFIYLKENSRFDILLTVDRIIEEILVLAALKEWYLINRLLDDYAVENAKYDNNLSELKSYLLKIEPIQRSRGFFDQEDTDTVTLE